MTSIQKFSELLVWQKAHQLVLEIYKITVCFPKFEEFGLANQMRRCSVSIASNIAEGFKRKSCKDSCHFYNISEGSLEELKYQLFLSKDLKYITKEKFEDLEKISSEIGRLLNGWIKIQK
jgi:four helix bundle protein